MTLALVVALLLQGAPAMDPAPIVAAERAFAADGEAMGIKRSFLKHSTPDAILLGAAPVNAHEDLKASPDLKPGESDGLAWWPLWAGISRGGDLGFTSGPAEVKGVRGGHYFTVWKRQPDGGYKWVYDGGVGATSKDEPGKAGPVAYLPLASAVAATPAAARAELAAAEAGLAEAARKDQTAAHLTALAEEGRIYVAPLPPGKDKAGVAAALAAWPAAFDFQPPLGTGISDSNDLAWTYGKAAWVRDGQARTGHYTRVWQRREAGWKLVYAQVLPTPPPAAPAGG